MAVEPTAPLWPVSTAVSTAASSPQIADGQLRLEQEVIDLFDKFRERLLRYLRHFRLDLPDREEIVQEVFLSLFQHLRRGKSRHDLRAWLFRVTHNQALKRHNRNRRVLETMVEPVVEDSAIDPAPNPEDLFVERETQARLIAVVNALTPQDRQCLALRAEGLRYREIADVLNISLGAVSVSLARSLARISRAAQR